jgi:hypothetical protein
MERRTATKGRYGRAAAGVEAIEIKATIPNPEIKGAMKRFALTPRNDEEREIYFFDTPALDLLRAGIILRARREARGSHDCTVKFRPVNPSDVAPKWRKYQDFKIEADASESSLVKSASFSMPVTKGLIKRVAAGKKPIAEIFGKEQVTFLTAMAGGAIDFASLAVCGPLRAHRWQFEDPGCPWPITAELWRRGDGKRLMEVSIKVPIQQIAVAVGGFMAFLAEAGVERDRKPQTKTRWALDYYVAKLTRRHARK